MEWNGPFMSLFFIEQIYLKWNTVRVQISAELIFAFFGPFREIKFREIYKLLLYRENYFREIKKILNRENYFRKIHEFQVTIIFSIMWL